MPIGSRSRCAACTRACRARSSSRSGRFPAGTPYRADQPDLLLWVLFTLVDSGIVVYRKYVGSMSRAEEAAYWDDYKVVGELFGLPRSEMPDSLDDLDSYRREMLEGDTLLITAWARDRAREIVLEPPVPWMARPLLETANFITIALLPDRIRDEYGFAPLPPARRAQAAGGRRRGVREAGGGAVPAGPAAAGAGGARRLATVLEHALRRRSGRV